MMEADQNDVAEVFGKMRVCEIMMGDAPTAAPSEEVPPFRPLSPEQMEMLELSPNPKLVLDSQFRIRFVNRVTTAYANVSRESLIGRNVWDCYPTLRNSIFHQAYQRVLDTGEPARFERHEIDGDRWQSVYAFPADGGVIAVLEDITEHRRNVDRLRESEETLRLAQEAANIGSFYRDLRTNETHWSDQLIRINGFDPATFDRSRIGKDPSLNLLLPPDEAMVHKAWSDIVELGQVQKMRLRIRRHNGELRHLQTSMILVRDGEGQPARVVGTVLDMTDQVEADVERQRIDAQMQQAQKLESLGVLAGGIAHDFNNLLVGILGNASLAMLEVEDPPAMRECLREIEQAAQRAAELTRQLLAYAGKGRYVIEQTDVTRTIDDMSVLLRSAIARNTTLEFDLAPSLPRIEADLGQFRQVVMTLVTNGSDALGERQGTVRLVTGSETISEAYLRECAPGTVALPGEYVFVEVRDTGSGMDAETRHRMFEPFFSTKFTGRGLGLAATMGIMRAHRGAIRVSSEPGVGTSVKLLFPISQNLSMTGGLDSSWRGSGDILVVDDEASVRAVTSSLLRRRGFTVTEAVDGTEGVDRFSADPSRWRLVLLDLTMPQLNGEQAMRAMRARRPDVPVLMMSGYNEADVKRDVGDCSGFLQKPFNSQELLKAVRSVLGEG
jgi:two-component system, cell cycle sensor histidine kinase and response regulator CckA